MRMRLLAAGIACIVAAAACGPAAPVATVAPAATMVSAAPATTSAALATSTPSSPVDNPRPVGEYRWSRASADVDQYTLQTDVAATPFGFVAVGVRLNTKLPDPSMSFAPGSNPLANLYVGQIWTSSNGRSWSRVAEQPDFTGARMEQVVGTDDGAVILANAGACLPDACGGLPPNGGTNAWTSTDGATWTSVTGTGLGDGAVSDVARTASGYVAVGFVAAAKPTMQAQSQAAVWRSPDARHWTAVAGLPTGATGLGRVWADGDRLVAVAAAEGTLAAWTSNDGGSTWKAGPDLQNECCASSAILGGTVVVAQDVSRIEEKIDAEVDTSDGHAAWARTMPGWLKGTDLGWAQVVGQSAVVFGWTVHRDADELLVADKAVAFASTDAKVWSPFALPSGWAGQMPVAVAVRGIDVVAILGPMDKPDGPPASPTTSLWIGTAGG